MQTWPVTAILNKTVTTKTVSSRLKDNKNWQLNLWQSTQRLQQNDNMVSKSNQNNNNKSRQHCWYLVTNFICMSVATSRTLNYQIDTTDQSVIQIFKSKLLHSQIRMHLIRNYKKHASILTHLKGKCLNCYMCNIVKLQNE